MSMFYDPATALLDHVNRANGYSNTVPSFRFTTDNVMLSTPAPIEGTWREETTDKNTYIRVSAKEDSTFKGNTVITYSRLQLGDFAHFRPLRKLPCHNVATVHDIIPNIMYYYTLYLDPAEVYDDDLTLDEEGTGTVTVRMKDTAIIFQGELTFDIVPGGAHLKDHMTVKSLEGLNYPVEDPLTETSAILYCYPMDLSEHRDILLDIEEGVLPDEMAETLAALLLEIDTAGVRGTWNADVEVNTWSLAGATVLHNGLNTLMFSSNQRFKYILQIQLREGVTTPSGVFYLHYNDPFDPNAPDL